MADIEIKARISADTSEATKGVDKLNNSLNNSKQSTKDSAGLFGNLKDTLGKVSPAADGAIGAFDGVGKSMWKLVANPVGAIILAIVAALALLYKSFTNSFEGGQKMEQIFAGIKAAGQALIDNLEKIGGAIVKLMSWDFSGAINDIKGVAKEAGAAYEAMAKLTKDAQKLHQEQLANDLDQAERAKKLAILREQATDETIPIAKRKAALQDLKKDAEQNSKDDIDLARRTTENKIAQLTLQKDGAKKNQDEINKLKIEQIKVETENAGELRRINKQLIAADKTAEAERKQMAADAKARKDKELADEKQYLQVKNKLTNEANLAAITNEVELAKQKILNSEKDKLKEVNDLKVNEEYKKSLREMIAKSTQQELDKIDAEYTAKQFEKTKKEFEDWKKQNDEKLAKQKEWQDKAQSDYINKQISNKLKEKQELDTIDLRLQTPAELYQQQLIDLQSKYKQELAIVGNNEELKARLQQEYAEQTTALKAKHLNDQLNETKSVGDNIASVIGQQTAVGKGLGIANALINTYQGATDALRAKSTLPSPFDVVAKIANVAAVLASGFKAVKAITSVQVPGAGGGGGANPSVPTPITPQQISTQLNASSIQGVGNAAGAGVGRSFVLDTDIKDNQERQARINRAARLG